MTSAVLDEVEEVASGVTDIERDSLFDLLYFYKNVLLHGNPRYQAALGKIHGFMSDFLRLEELPFLAEKYTHSPIRNYLPAKDSEGMWPERWMYWPTLDATPCIEDGPDTQLAKDFHAGHLLTEQRGGILLRVVAEGDIKYQLVPRGYLKTSLGTFAGSMQDIIRDPSYRILIRSGEEDLPAKIMGYCKHTCENNKLFQQFWGGIIPDRHASSWNRTQMQFASDVRRGADPTLAAFGINTNITGSHGDKLIFDDVVTLQNINLQDKVKDKVSEAAFVVDRGFQILGQGTMYRDDDAHSMFVRPTGGGYPFTSMLVASLTDSRGKPTWEYYDDKLIAKKKGLCLQDGTKGLQFWYAQQYNNPFIAKVEGFREEWLKESAYDPEKFVSQMKLSVVMAVDPGYGVSESAGYASGIVRGQASDGRRYTLDGFKEKLTPDELPETVVAMAAKWCDIAGGVFRLGIEEASMKSWLFKSIQNEMRRRGVSFVVEPLKHGNRNKNERVRILGPAYSASRILWPEGPMQRTTRQWLVEKDGSVNYDFKESHRNEYTKFPAIRAELLDSEAYAEGMAQPDPMRVTEEPERKDSLRGQYVYRRVVEEEVQQEGRYMPRGLEAAERMVRSGGGFGRAMRGE